MNRAPKTLLVILVLVALGGLAVYFSFTSDSKKTDKEAQRFYAVALQGTHLLDALREAPDFHGIYFGTCAHIEKAGTSGDSLPFVFMPKVGERVKFSSVKNALENNFAMLRDYPACRQASVVFMKIFPYRGVVAVELDAKGYITKATEPFFSN